MDNAVTLRIIWANFLRAIWHIGVTPCPTGHKASGRRFDPSSNCFVTCSSRLIPEFVASQIKTRFRSRTFPPMARTNAYAK